MVYLLCCTVYMCCALQLADFVSRYMPAYKAYLPALYGQGPKGAREEHMLLLLIDENRNPVG
jgi:D-glycerate 3-kinase